MEDFPALGPWGDHFLGGNLTAVANSLALWHICDRKTPRSVLLFLPPLRFLQLEWCGSNRGILSKFG